MGKIDAWVQKIPRLKNAKVSRFSYRDIAYTNDDIEGVENYDYTRDMNVPTLNKTDTESSVLDSGARAQFSSLSKNALNHFFGRVSYNLNKVIDFLSDFLDDFISFTEIVSFSSSATLSNYADGTTKRLLNTAGSTITITLPAGETYLGSNTILLAPSIMLTITKRGTVWINSSGNAITADRWKTARNITITDADGTNTGTAVSVDGSENETLKLPSTIKANLTGGITGNAATADKWKTARNITISDADGTNTGTAVSVDGSENETLKLPATIKATLNGNASTATTANIRVSLRHGTTWFSKVWGGVTSLAGEHIWTDGDNIYYSWGQDTQYVLNKLTSTWSSKTWNGINHVAGSTIWTDGDNIYNSYLTDHHVLNKATSTWSSKTWIGLTDFIGYNTWTDGDNIYYSDGATQYVLNKSTSTWSSKTWKGLTNFSGVDVWTEGDNIYYSNGTAQYVLNKSTSTWSSKTWIGLPSFEGKCIWTDGDNIYYDYDTTHYVLNKSTSTWSSKIWIGLPSFYSNNIWTDGDNIYISHATQSVLPATRHNYVDENKYQNLFRVSTSCKLKTLTKDFVFSNE